MRNTEFSAGSRGLSVDQSGKPIPGSVAGLPRTLAPGIRVLRAFAERGYMVIEDSKVCNPDDGRTDDSEIARIIEQESGLVGLINALDRISNRDPIDGFENAFRMCRIIACEALKKARDE